jgi:hypothetical protein
LDGKKYYSDLPSITSLIKQIYEPENGGIVKLTSEILTNKGNILVNKVFTELFFGDRKGEIQGGNCRYNCSITRMGPSHWG